MVDTFGFDISNAFNYGEEVKEIYSNGVLVWSNIILPDGYTLRNWISSKYVGTGVTPPVLELSGIKPTSSSRIEMDVTFTSFYTVGQWGLFSDYITPGIYGSDGVDVNVQTYVAFLISGAATSNVSNIRVYANTDYNITIDNSSIYCNGVKLNQDSGGLNNRYGEGIVLFANYPYGYARAEEDGKKWDFNYFTRYKRFKHYIILSDGSEYLVNDLVPVTNESGVPGMYDLVREVFYKKPSTSTGDFSYG